MEGGIISSEELSIKTTLKKNPSDYKPNSLQRKIGLELEAEQGDVLKYDKSHMVGGGTINTYSIESSKISANAEEHSWRGSTCNGI